MKERRDESVEDDWPLSDLGLRTQDEMDLRELLERGNGVLGKSKYKRNRFRMETLEIGERFTKVERLAFKSYGLEERIVVFNQHMEEDES